MESHYVFTVSRTVVHAVTAAVTKLFAGSAPTSLHTFTVAITYIK